MQWLLKMEFYGPNLSPRTIVLEPGCIPTAGLVSESLSNLVLDALVDQLEGGNENLELFVEVEITGSPDRQLTPSSSSPSPSESPPPTTKKSSVRTRRSGSS